MVKILLLPGAGNIMKYTREGGDIELRHKKGIWELAPAETEDKAGGVLKEFGGRIRQNFVYFFCFLNFPPNKKKYTPEN